MTKTKSTYCENYMHCCNEPKIDFSSQARTISAMYGVEETNRLLNFYLYIGPASGNDFASTTIRSLASYGWRGHQLTSLERKLLASSGISSFCMLNSERIDATLASMDLVDKICPAHPRAVIQRTVKKIQLKEDGQLSIEYVDANRMRCLFRHIRNSIAHGLIYEVSESCLLLEDRGRDKLITARILIKKRTLIDWIDIIEKGPNAS